MQGYLLASRKSIAGTASMFLIRNCGRTGHEKICFLPLCHFNTVGRSPFSGFFQDGKVERCVSSCSRPIGVAGRRTYGPVNFAVLEKNTSRLGARFVTLGIFSIFLSGPAGDVDISVGRLCNPPEGRNLSPVSLRPGHPFLGAGFYRPPPYSKGGMQCFGKLLADSA